MDRRTFLTGTGAALLAAPFVAEAQPTKKEWRIGFLSSRSSPANLAVKGPFREGLHDLGYIEGRDFVMEWRWAEGHQDRLPALAADLVRAQVDVIVTAGSPATFAAKQATQTIPIVFASAGSVVQRGIVASLARPGGNVTGLQQQLNIPKLIQLLKDTVPTVTRVAFIYDPVGNAPEEFLRTKLKELRSKAQSLNVEVQPVAVSDPSGIPQAFAEFGRGTNGLVLENPNVLFLTADEVCRLAAQRRLPTIGWGARFASAGCLMSYGENSDDMSRRAAYLVDRILKGAKPGNLPVEQPNKFEFVINLKTAKALGLTIPPSLLGRADEVIHP
jgi:putative ABC transport system substrate-binding protein